MSQEVTLTVREQKRLYVTPPLASVTEVLAGRCLVGGTPPTPPDGVPPTGVAVRAKHRTTSMLRPYRHSRACAQDA